MATPDALNAVVTRNEYYRDGYRRLQKIALAEALAILGLILVLALTISVTKGKDRFFATTSDGRLLQMVPLDQPNLPTAKLVSWAASSATEIMPFGCARRLSLVRAAAAQHHIPGRQQAGKPAAADHHGDRPRFDAGNA